MWANPAVLIFSGAIVIFMCVFSIINKPRKPVLTFTLLFLFAVFLGSMALINYRISASAIVTEGFDITGFITSVLTARQFPTVEELENAFNIYKYGIIILGIGSVVTMIFECRRLINYVREKDISHNDKEN